MTDEQIKEDAELYAWKKIKRTSDKQFTQALVEAYLEGAHSRDEEVKELYGNLERFRSTINNLRHPWVNVLNGLPEEDPDDKGYSVSVIGLFPDGRVDKCFCSIEEGIWFIEGLVCDKPTHWMPMPEV